MFRKISFPICNRSEYSKVKYLIKKMNLDTYFDVRAVVSGSLHSDKFGQAVNDVISDGITVDEIPPCLIISDSIAGSIRTMGLQSMEFAGYYDINKFDLAIVVGDRWDIMSAVIPLSMFNIPIAHVQGGEISGTIDDVIRNVITKYSHLHFVSNNVCMDRVVNMNEDSQYVYDVGCPSIDSILSWDFGSDIDMNMLLPHMKDPVSICKKDDYFIIMIHPNVVDRNDINVNNVAKAIDEFPNKKIWFYPNNDPYNESIISCIRRRNDIKFKHLPMRCFAMLMKHARCIVGNSSAGIRESASFGIPAVNIGSRQQGRDRNTNVIDSDSSTESIVYSISQALNIQCDYRNIYGDGRASDKMIDILKSIKSIKYKNII